jgi:hypothetical protein
MAIKEAQRRIFRHIHRCSLFKSEKEYLTFTQTYGPYKIKLDKSF